jgi:hypothetical protein
VIDVAGETNTRTYAVSGPTNVFNAEEKLVHEQEKMVSEAISKMCDGIYDGIMRNKELGLQFWTQRAPHLVATPTAVTPVMATEPDDSSRVQP